jgi:hypothetical protein
MDDTDVHECPECECLVIRDEANEGGYYCPDCGVAF